ncbi:MAG: aldose 1-epimerase family protein [Solirubrobacteraceae bacterium]
MSGSEPSAVPSGEQHTITHGAQRVVAVQVGGGLRSYSADGEDVLDGYAPEEMCSGARGQLLAPWPNRVAGGRWQHVGRPMQLALTEPEAGNAIHGLVRWAAWAVAEHEPDRVRLIHRLHPQPGWPGTLDLRVEYRLTADGLTVASEAVNVGPEPCPYGIGAHPYLTLGTPSIDPILLELPARSRLQADDQGIPNGIVAVEGSRYDFSTARAIGADRLDTGFTDLRRDGDGRARARIATADGSRRATLWVDGAYTHLMVFTGDTLAPQARRRGVAIEPMSCPPNALATGEGLIWLGPGDGHSARWGISTG